LNGSRIWAVCLLAALFALPVHPENEPLPLQQQVRSAIGNALRDNSLEQLYAWKVRKHHGREWLVEHEVQTPEGVVSRVLLIDDRPLNTEQQNAEDERLRKMIDPDEMRKNLRSSKEDDARTNKLLGAIPDAFEFSLIDSSTAPNGHQIDNLHFTPRSGFEPPSRETNVLTGMDGVIELDQTAGRIVKIDGTLFRDVNFGWGIFGKLYKGGRFLVEQSEITPTHWDTTHMLLHFDGKIMLFKSIHIDENETSWDYQPVPPMSVDEALEYLKHNDPPVNALLKR
jgi:hypothetical protein